MSDIGQFCSRCGGSDPACYICGAGRQSSADIASDRKYAEELLNDLAWIKDTHGQFLCVESWVKKLRAIAPAQSVDGHCQKCGCALNGEAALVVWCHPCADAAQPAAPVETCPYAIDGCVLENQSVGPCLCANPVKCSSAATCDVCCGSGYSNHPDSGEVCSFCNGSGARPVKPQPSAGTERPPCPRCSFPYEPGAAERYWEARWRDEKAENDRLRAVPQEAWQPIETAPKDGSRIVVGRDMGTWGFVRGIAHWEDIRGISGWVTTAAFSDPPGVLGLGNPTHWLVASAVTRPQHPTGEA